MSKSTPWVRFFPSNWLAGASKFTPEERGTYITLLAIIYDEGGPIERDDRALAHQCGMTKYKFSKALERLISMGKIEVKNGKLTNSKAEIELDLSQKRVESASKGGRIKAEKANKNNKSDAAPAPAPANAIAPTNNNHNKNIKEDTKVSKKKTGNRGCSIPDDFEPDMAYAGSQGLNFEQTNREAENFKDYWRAKTGQGATKKDWPATWRMWVRNAVSRLPSHSQAPKRNKWDIAADEIKRDMRDPFAIPDRSASSQPRMKIISPAKGN